MSGRHKWSSIKHKKDTELTVQEICKQAYETSTANGFTHENVPGMLMLIVSEVAEAMEAHRKPQQFRASAAVNLFNQGIYYSAISPVFEEEVKRLQRLHIAEEIADVVIRCADFCQSQGLDLQQAIIEKMAKNKTRGFRHGDKAY